MTDLPIIDSQPDETLALDSTREPKGTYAFVSLGCPKNLIDSERMLGLLDVGGYQLVREPVGADFVVINTCGFIESARQESCGVIEEMLALKRQGDTRGVVVAGCLAERQKESLLTDFPEVDHVVGVFGREEITRVADRLLGNLDEQRAVFRPAPVAAFGDRGRLRVTPRHFAYLKVSEGCDRLCTFCAIPQMRGKHVSKPIEEVRNEAEELVADGVRELIVVAQDTTYYGRDIYGESRLAELLVELEAVEGLDWIRLMYFYPMYVTDLLIDRIADSDKIVPYIDMPLQHASDAMLKRMARRTTRAETETLLDKLRNRIADLTLRTTLITGFPGETEEQFQELAAFVETQRFERVGVFTYSPEPNTPAVKLPNAVAAEVAEERRAHLMAVQQGIAFEHATRQVGKRIDVILDAPIPDQPDAWIGRSAADAPDVDPVVIVSGEDLQSGQIVPCEVVATNDYDLVAAAVGRPR
jgi:ribosomal protein S12 methylthiotransferase